MSAVVCDGDVTSVRVARARGTGIQSPSKHPRGDLLQRTLSNHSHHGTRRLVLNRPDRKPEQGHFRAGAPPRRFAALAAVVLLAVVPACRPSDSGRAAPQSSTDHVDKSVQAPGEDIWEAHYLRGTKIGYGHTTIRAVTRDGRKLLHVHSTNHLEITRFGQKTQQDMVMEIVESPDGTVVEFKTEAALGPSPMVVTGRVEGERMTITTKTQGRGDTTRIAWSSDVRGFRAVEQSLERQPMKPGERRSFKMFIPLLNQIAEAQIVAHAYENTPVLGVEANLLRIDCVARLPGGQSITSILWTDAQGRVIKTRVAALEQESFRTTPELALAPARDGVELDIGLDLIVKVEPPLENPHRTRQVRYRVELAQGDPAKVFATGPLQSVTSTGPHAASVIVRSLRPDDVQPLGMPPAPVAAEYTSANSVLQIDDPRIRQMASEAKQEATNSKDLAIALERYVHRAVSEKNFSHGFATAADVAQSREGDCTEHAVLLAALLRVCGIPSRVAIGLVYVERMGGFGYHMWTEALLDGQWVPLDATVGQGGTSAAYLKLSDSSLDGASVYSSFLVVADVLGQLKVGVIEAE